MPKRVRPFKFVKCSVDGCDKNGNRSGGGARGLCSLHYARLRNHGSPLETKSTPKGDAKSFYENTVLPYDGDECLIWPYSNKGGYGTMNRDGRPVVVSRALCEDVNGPPPTPDHEAAHSCGNGNLGCVTKNHLRWATHKENSEDNIIQGKTYRGERSPHAKLTEAEVIQIFSDLKTLSQREVAKKYGVSMGAINSIKLGRTWAWLRGDAA